MKYKTLFRLGLKLLGLYLFLDGSAVCVSRAAWLAPTFLFDAQPDPSRVARGVLYGDPPLLTGALLIVFGLYLFFSGKWIADKAIPSNRPYCPDCAYDLTGATGPRCPECGTPFDPTAVAPPNKDIDAA